MPLLQCAASVDVGCIPLVVEFCKCSPGTTAQWLLGSSQKQHLFVSSNSFTRNNHSGCAAFIHPTRSYPHFSARSDGLSRLIQHFNKHKPDRAGTHEATGEGVTQLVIALPHGGSVTVQFNTYLLLSTQSFVVCCVLMHCGSACENTSPLTLTLALSLYINIRFEYYDLMFRP